MYGVWHSRTFSSALEAQQHNPKTQQRQQVEEGEDICLSFKYKRMGKRRDAETELNLPPGFRFHPTDEELVVHYLCRKASHQSLPVPIIAEVDLYKYDPWQLPEKALFGKKEWYFFTPRDRKYPNGSRPNRAAGSGYWKATGADKPIRPTGSTKHVAIKKALVFYTGKAPKGVKTNWIMHEYRFTDSKRSADKDSLKLDEWVLCRLYNKKNDCEKEHQAKEESVEESMDSYDPIKEARSDRIPESDIDNDLGGAPHCQSQALAGAQRMSTNEGGHFNEDHGWFAGLNLEDLKNSLSAYGGSQIPDFMYNGFYFGAEPVLDISGVGRRLEPQIEMAPHSFKLFIYQSS